MPSAHLCPPAPGKPFLLATAAGFTGLGVALGAFGAHALRATLEAHSRLDEWQTAVQYQLIHGVALLALAIWRHVAPAERQPGSGRLLGALWSAGILCFSGSLYALCLGAPTGVLWPVTPLGGLCFLAGWLVLGVDALRSARPDGRQAGP